METSPQDGADEIQALVDQLMLEREEVASEIEGNAVAHSNFLSLSLLHTILVLKSIYGENAVQPWHPTRESGDAVSPAAQGAATVRYTVSLRYEKLSTRS
jgi:hypothetical protein